MPTARQPRSLEIARDPLRGGMGDDIYIPHPAPNAAGNEDDNSKMGSSLSLLKVGSRQKSSESVPDL
jgi:hypothetical protein